MKGSSTHRIVQPPLITVVPIVLNHTYPLDCISHECTCCMKNYDHYGRILGNTGHFLSGCLTKPFSDLDSKRSERCRRLTPRDRESQTFPWLRAKSNCAMT